MLVLNLVQIPISLIRNNCSPSVGYLTSWHRCRMVSMSLIPFWGPPNAPAFLRSHSPCVLCFSTKSWWCGIAACLHFFLKIQSYSRTPCFPTNHLSFHLFSWKNWWLVYWDFQAPNVFHVGIRPCWNPTLSPTHNGIMHHVIGQYFMISLYDVNFETYDMYHVTSSKYFQHLRSNDVPRLGKPSMEATPPSRIAREFWRTLRGKTVKGKGVKEAPRKWWLGHSTRSSYWRGLVGIVFLWWYYRGQDLLMHVYCQRTLSHFFYASSMGCMRWNKFDATLLPDEVFQITSR